MVLFASVMKDGHPVVSTMTIFLISTGVICTDLMSSDILENQENCLDLLKYFSSLYPIKQIFSIKGFVTFKKWGVLAVYIHIQM